MRQNGELPTTMLQVLSGGVCLTIDQLHQTLDFNRRQISDGVRQLMLRGFAERIELGCYQLSPAGVEAAARGETISSGPYRPQTGLRKPPRNRIRQRAWNAMRISQTWTIGDLVVVASADDGQDDTRNIRVYVRQLKLAGYVIELPTRSNGDRRFRLLKDTGELAPVWRRSGFMVDHNRVPS